MSDEQSIEQAVLGYPADDVAGCVELVEHAFDRDLTGGRGTDENDVRRVDDCVADLGTEGRVVVVPPQEGVRIEQELPYPPKTSKPGTGSSNPGLMVIWPARRPGLR